jgi:hypothetical protein
MAKNEVKIKINVDGKELSLTKKQAKALGKQLDNTGKSAHTVDRRLKGAAQASSNTTKNFSKMAQGVSGGLVPAYATLAAQMFALGAVFRGLQQAADFRVLNQGMKVFAANSGVMVKSLSKNLQEATGHQLDFRQAAQSSQIMLAAGFSEDQMGALATAARGASTALGRDFEDSFNRLVRGVTKAEPELLDELGIILRLEKATEQYGRQIGKSAKDLTTFEKSQAVLNEVLTQSEQKYGAVGEAVPVNQFNKLIATFIDLKDKAMEFITPIAEVLAGFFTENIKSAVAVLAIFASTLLKSVLPAFDELSAKIDNSRIGKFAAGIGDSFGSMKGSAAEFKSQLGGQGTAKAKKLSQGFDSKAALKSSGINALKKGENLTRQQMSGLKGALKKAEAEYKKHGKITTGIFAGENIKKVRGFKSSLKQMEIESSKTNMTMRTGLKLTGIAIKGTFQGMAIAAKVAFKGMAIAAKGAAGAVNLAFRAVAIFGFIQLAMDGLKALTANFDKVMAGFASAIRMVGNGIAKLANFLSGIPLVGKFYKAGGEFAQEKLAGIADSIEAQLESGEGMIGQMAHKAKKERPGSILAEQFDSAQEKLKSLHTEFKDMMSAREGLDQTAGQKFEANVATVASSGIQGQAARLLGMESRTGEDAFTADQLEKQRSALIQYGKDLGGINPTIADLFSQYEKGEISTEKLTEGLKNVTTQAGAQNAAFKQINTTIEGFQKQYSKLSKRDPLDDLLSSYKNLDDTIKLTGDNKESVVQKIYESVFGARAEGTSLDDMTAALDRFAAGLGNVIDTRRQLELDALDNKVAGARNANKKGAAATFAQEDIKLEDLRIAKEKRQAKVDELDLIKVKTPLDEHNLAIAQKQLAVAQEQEKAYAHSITLAGKLQNTFSQGIQKMFEDIATGSASAKDAFKSLATLVLQEMAKIAAMKMAASVTGFLGFAQGGIIPVRGMASGGYTSVGQKRFGTGGIATSPTIMVGEGRYNEAVVPLPDGRRIPVEMMGSGAGTNNVTINVDAGGNASSTGNAEQAQALGMSIQAAVMETLQREKRPGGVLGGG